ncbi:MAG TPA: PEP-utilizing enzyme, partial [Anaeromyxobacteraceae bacterium]
ASRVAAVYQRLRRLVEADLDRDGPQAALSGETVRRVQMFEDPQRLDEVTTLHGLKRYLHQQGLRLAFRLFPSHQAADRTVDLLVAGEREVLRCERVIRYLEFEPTQPVGLASLPFVVSLLAAAFGRQLLLGRKLPWATVLGFGNEVQLYVNYRNHPAFVRIDLSPPRRGGMIDLEYFAVSQYELDQHPDPSLQAIQRVLRELDFDVSKDGLRLRARYDKERAVDLGDVIAKARALFDLLPYLMEVDWIVGDLDYPAAARAEVAAAWAGFFARWGALPSSEVLSASRRKIVVGVEPDPAGPREVLWDGRGACRDRFSGTPPEGLAERLRSGLERLGLGGLMAGAPAGGGAFGQRQLEQAVLEPLAEATRRGEVRETPAGIEPVPGDLFQRQHEATRLAAVLAEGGPALGRAAQMAALVRAVERQARFHTTGSIQGHPVQAASLPTGPRAVGLFVLRDPQGIARLALAAEGGVLYRTRDAPDRPWLERDELGTAELVRLLRARNYLGAGSVDAAPPTGEVLEALRGRFSAPSPAPVPRQGSGERFIPATVAAPGRATGFARFHGGGGRPADFDRAVLVARVVRPEDAPWLRHASGILSTGGGILSHVGLIALELEKPAAILEGRWSLTPSGAEVLLVRRPQWREVESTVAGWQVVCRHELRDAEEAMEQGDLLCLDGESEGLVVLGHDPQALALHQDLSRLEAAAMALAATRSDAEILACRGRLIRALHQLERLLGRLERPGLVRHAVRELLTLPRAPLAAEGRQGRRRLLGALLANPACGEEARLSVARRLHDLRQRVEAASRSAVDDLPHLRHPVEVLFSRLGVRRMRETLADALELARAGRLDAGALDAGAPGDAEEVDAACRRRLEEMHSSLAAAVARCEEPGGERWRLRHLLPRLAELVRALQGATAAPPRAELAKALRRVDAARLRELGGRRVLRAGDGGAELGPLAGGKAAHLGEIARVLGEEAVPPWFAVADAAFREVLATPVPPP